MVKEYRKSKSKIIQLTAAITLGLFVSAFLIALGGFVNIDAFAGINRIRFISHELLIPLLFTIFSLALELEKPFSTIIYGITAVLMILGLAESIATTLGVAEIANISRYASVGGETPAWAETVSMLLSFGTVIPLMITGIIVWIKEKTPFLFLYGIFKNTRAK